MSRCYIVAGKAVEAVLLNGQSFKSYCSSVKIGKMDYLLATECLKYRTVLEMLFDRIKLDVKSKNLGVQYGIFIVMMYELLFGRKKIDGGGAVKRKVLEYYNEVKEQLDDVMRKMSLKNTFELLSPSLQQANNLTA